MMKLMFPLLALMTAAPAFAEGAGSGLAAMPLFTKGLIVTAGGLGGVFLVLVLFFLVIKAMGKLLK